MEAPAVKSEWTESDFEQMCWHDNCVYALRFDEVSETWKSDLILDIDYIVEWVCSPEGGCRFWISPATLVFHDVTDPKVAMDWGDSGFQVSIHKPTIGGITRERIVEQKICFDRPYYRWTIDINWPSGGSIAFGATGFTQRLHAPPILCDAQVLPAAERRRLTKPENA